METKFTKGEWKLSRVNKLRIFTGNFIVADAKSFSREIPYNEAEANAKLIAAAPDMFEHLQSIVDGNAFDPETGYIWLHRLEAIKNTIKKATE